MAAALPLEEAQARLLALATPLPAESCAVSAALGRYLAEPLVARRTQPSADLSAMDGYALCGTDLAGPWRVIGESAAGHPYDGPMEPGDAVRISTGALMPRDAGTVLLQEDAQREGDHLSLSGDDPRPGQHVRRAGFDFRAGDCLVDRGKLVTPALAGLALAAGNAGLRVHGRPRLAIIDSGDELATDPSACAHHEIPASNGAMLTALAAGIPSEVMRLGPVPDRQDALVAAFARAEDADLIVTSGGASVGDHDLVRPALAEWGAEIDFWKVAMKPGKPIMVARRGRQLVLGLPGNPVSSYVTAFLFMLPVLRALSGAAQCLPLPLDAPCNQQLSGVGARLEFLRAVWNGQDVAPLSEQDSSGLSALAAANALVMRPAGASALQPGERVPVYLLANGGMA